MSPEQRQFILSLDRDGQLAPDDVLAAAEPDDSPIHSLFTWDDEVAGHRYRMTQARDIIKRVRVNYIASEPKVREIRIAEYIHDPDLPQGQQGYIRTGLLRTREESALMALQTELDRVEALVERTRLIAAQLGLSKNCEAGLKAILTTRKAAKAG